jgi:fructose-1,6-bisphosphatase/inositol monophosphatase family enzyme
MAPIMNISPQWIKLALAFRKIAAEELLPRHLQLGEIAMRYHTDGSPVTDADMISEQRLIAAAAQLYPTTLATGEESISEDPEQFFKDHQHQDLIIFDPLDGTKAFINGSDVYGMMGAYIRNGKTIGGIIYCPGNGIADDSGALQPQKDITIITECGQGCWTYTGTDTQHARQLTIDRRATTLSGNANVAFACRNQDAIYESRLPINVPGYHVRWHANHDYLRILMGTMDATFYSEGWMETNGNGKCPPWDHAAGVLAVQEAGGYVAIPYGSPTDGGQVYTPLHCHDRLLVAANRPLFDDMMRHIATYAPELLQPR